MASSEEEEDEEEEMLAPSTVNKDDGKKYCIYSWAKTMLL